MDTSGYTIAPGSHGGFLVRVGNDTAGTVAEDGEYPGLWSAWDGDGQFLGRAGSQAQAVAFLASCFGAEEAGWP